MAMSWLQVAPRQTVLFDFCSSSQNISACIYMRLAAGNHDQHSELARIVRCMGCFGCSPSTRSLLFKDPRKDLVNCQHEDCTSACGTFSWLDIHDVPSHSGGVVSPTYQVFLVATSRVTPNQYMAQLRTTDYNALYPFMALLPNGAIITISGTITQFYRSFLTRFLPPCNGPCV